MVRHNRLGLSWTIATVAFVACGDSTGPSEVSSVVVTPAAATVVSLGDTVQLTATALDADGNTITGATFVWASSDPATATVSDAGVVTAIASGTATVTAANGGVTSNGAAITVQQDVATIDVSPDTLSFAALGSVDTLDAVARDARGSLIPDVTFTWVSGNTDVATVSSDGVVTSVGNDTTTVTAAFQAVAGTAIVAVAQTVNSLELSGDSAALIVGDTIVLAATAKDANNNLVVNASVTWSTSDMTVATVDAQGLVRAVGDGAATITAAAGSATGVATLTVADSVASYIVTFDATWSAETHPVSFPGNPHFSRLIGGTHNAEVVVWQVGTAASTGIKDMAELGATSPLDSEIEAAIQAGTAWRLLQGGNIGLSPGSASPLAFEIHAEFPLVTLVSMIAPSPDWFVGVHSMSLFANGAWIDRIVIELAPYDAGTDSGVIYTSSNLPTQPPVAISLLDTVPFDMNQVLGTFTFERQQ
ncbi:MAG: spondin domain-containing protein [Gemmatimonadetes bacterium]|nr:spondin domain-containing protein [Gemmatimonadota bacterium]